MTVQSDRQIRALCERHAGTVRFGARVGMSAIEVEERVYRDSGVSIEEQISKLKTRYPNSTTQHMLSMLDDERFNQLKAEFKPMIEPFLPTQVREHERNGTDYERMLLDYRKVTSAEEALAVLNSKRITGVRTDVLLGLQVRERILSKGLTSYGYDVSLADEFKIFTNLKGETIDPLDFDEDSLLTTACAGEDGFVILPPNSYLLGRTNEYFRMPRDIVALCVGKSTYARCGAHVNVTPIEPGFEGYVVIEISNATNSPMKIYANQGIAQFIFVKGEPCAVSYGDRNDGKGGKYQGQTGITLAKG